MRKTSTVMFDKYRNRGGFTLIELLIVISIIAILATIAVPLFLGQRTKAMRTEAMTNLEALRLLQEQYYAENGEYAPDAGTCGADNPGNIVLIQVPLPSFKPGLGADLFFSYCIEADVDFDGNPTADACFRARAFGNSGTPVDVYVLNVDCNNVKSF